MEEVRDRQDEVAVGEAGEEPAADEIGPVVGIDFGAGEAKARFAGKGNAANFAAMQTAILSIAHGVRIATVEHFLDDLIVIFCGIARIGIFEGWPVFAKNTFERGFIDMRA